MTLSETEIAFALDQMKQLFPNASSTLTKTDPFHFLLAIILSAQTTDKAVNEVTPALFAAYQTPMQLAQADPKEIEQYIKKIGLYHNKARYLVACAQDLVNNFAGQVPQTRAELMSLHGVGRKTADVALAECFQIPALAVDTHVKRVANRLGMVDTADVLKSEQELMKKIPKDRWIEAHHLLIFFGRYQCLAKKPKCGQCPLSNLCEYNKKSSF